MVHSRCCNVHRLLIQTAGGTGANGIAEAVLYEPIEPMRVRDAIVAQRDALVHGNFAPGNMAFASSGPSAPMAVASKLSPPAYDKGPALMDSAQTTSILNDIRYSVKRIEETTAAMLTKANNKVYPN